MNKQSEITKIYFNAVATDWFKISYDPEDKFLKFPVGKVRQNITFSEMERLNTGRRVIDLGCGTGQLVIELLRNGYEAIGIDSAANMITEARQALLNNFPTADSSRIFDVKDTLNLDIPNKFDVVTAMGLLEYLEDDFVFFEAVKRLIRNGGYAFIECRNKLFNIASGNQYTLDVADTGDLKRLICQLDRIQKYSPASNEETEEIVRDTFVKTANAIMTDYSSKRSQDEIPRMQEFPTKMVRRQHTPEELEKVLERMGLRLSYVVYYHCHPYPPRYEKLFPVVFNRMSFLMQPIGYTQLGSTICSAFIAVITK